MSSQLKCTCYYFIFCPRLFRLALGLRLGLVTNEPLFNPDIPKAWSTLAPPAFVSVPKVLSSSSLSKDFTPASVKSLSISPKVSFLSFLLLLPIF